VPDVRTVARYRVAKFKIGNATKQLVGLPVTALDPSSPNLMIRVGIRSGDISTLADHGLAVQATVARDHGWSVGDLVTVTFPTGNETLRIAATYGENTLVGDYVVAETTFDKAYATSNDFLLLVLVNGAAQLKPAQAAIKAVIDNGYPGLKVQDRAEYIAATKAQVAQFTNLITALLVLAVVIALIGVLITMLLSVSERTHELGLLRAVGMSRGQTRSMVRWEAAIVSVYGALLGLALGVFFGLALVGALRDKGVNVTVVPYQPLLILAGVIACLGVLASMYPARRASRLNVIAAVSSL